MIPANAANQLAIDVNSLAQTKRLAKEDPRAAMKNAAQQFEAVFLQMVLKAMRDASPKEGMFDNEQSRLVHPCSTSNWRRRCPPGAARTGSCHREAAGARSVAAGAGAAAADGSPLPHASQQQLQRAPQASAPTAVQAGPSVRQAPAVPAEAAAVPAPAREFVNRLWSQAGEASRATGIPAHFMIAQAALETGWGRAELRFSDGTPTYNLFGIKAGRNWQGAVAEATTTEYVNGVAQQTVERFRAYSSYAEAFRDYASLLTSNPRYAAVLNQQDAAGFARGLQRAGYATDPMYAAKLERMIGGQTLRAGMIG